MISRKSSLIISLAYDKAFVSSQKSSIFRTFRNEKLYEYLYARDYEEAFLGLIRQIKVYQHTRQLKDFILQLHTGESLVNATQDWTWDARRSSGQYFLKKLALDIMISYLDSNISSYSSDIKSVVMNLKNQLELDGYIYDGKQLILIESNAINENEEKEFLVELASSVTLSDITTIKHHIKLAQEHFINSNWDDSISNSRKFLEAILAQVADSYHIMKYSAAFQTSKLEKPFEVRNFLNTEGVIDIKEKEALAKIYSLLSETGSHPYMAHKDQARLMWNLSLTMSQFVLLRFKGITQDIN